MAGDIDVAVVGGGHNGLVAATYLARAGLSVHVFERRSFTGGAAITEELWPGFKFSTCAHMVHGIQPKIYRDFQLLERGMEVIPRQGIQVLPDGTYFGPKTHDSPRNRSLQLTPAEREGQRPLWGIQEYLAAGDFAVPAATAALAGRGARQGRRHTCG